MLTDEWLTRDAGKHHLRPEDKLQLMENIAADMWRAGTPEWPWNRVLDWLTRQLEHKTVWRTRYLQLGSLEMIEEDFRTATFVLRPSNSQDRFRFAHTSLQEYFLARYILRTIVDDEWRNWDLPLPSPETLDFLGQLLLTNPSTRDCVLRGMEAILEEAPAGGATEIVFRYWLQAIRHDLPQPVPLRVNLQGTDLSGLVIRGRSSKEPLRLATADLSRTDLTGCRFYDVDLSRASLASAQAEHAEFHRVIARGINLSGADLTASVWRSSRVSGLGNKRPAEWYESHWIDCDLDPDELPDNFGRDGVFSDHHAAGRSAPRIEGLEASRVTTIFGHKLDHGVYVCEISPDGNLLATSGVHSVIKLWDMRTGTCVHTLERHRGPVYACAFSPDGNYIVSGAHEATLKLWDVRSGECLRELKGKGHYVESCAFSPDGKRVVSGWDDGTLQFFDAQTGNRTGALERHRTGVGACRFTSDGDHVVSGSGDGTLKLWNLRTHSCVQTLEAHAGWVAACQVAPEGDRLSLPECADDSLELLWPPRFTPAISTDGKRVVFGLEDGTLQIWDTRTGNRVRTPEAHTSEVTGCGLSPSGDRIASGSRDGSAKIWDSRTGRCLRTLEAHTPPSANACAASPDGETVLSGYYDGDLRIWSSRTGHCIRTMRGHTHLIMACDFSPDGDRAASVSADGTLKIWELRTGRCLSTLWGHADWVSACRFAPDGGSIVTGSYDGTLVIWNSRTGDHLHKLAGHKAGVHACAFSPDGSVIISASRDGTLRIWDSGSGRCLRILQGDGGVTGCGFSPDGGSIVSVSANGSLTVWELPEASGRVLINRADRRGQFEVSIFAISEDGGYVVSGTRYGGLVLRDPRTGRRLRNLRVWDVHKGRVHDCAVSPKGDYIVTASEDGTLTLWAPTGDPQLTLINGLEGETAAVDYRANRIVSASPDAWRFLGWRYYDPEAKRLRILPPDYAGLLPGVGAVDS